MQLRKTPWNRKRAHKYGARSCRCNQDHRHDSIGEARYCDNLSMIKERGFIKDFRTQARYILTVNGKKICEHRVDFEVDYFNKPMEVHEFKGFATREWAMKKKLFEALYPAIPYKVVRK